jgi:2-isopropylmalate synthase
MAERLYLYDTTLRDGAQTQGVDFTAADKIAIAQLLDQLGVDYVEGGWPGANPTDDGFFANPPALTRVRLCAFGMTRRSGRSAANDPGLAALFQSQADAITLVDKSSARQVELALGVPLDENLRMIEDSVAAACRRVSEVMFDAEHFFDGYLADPDYALACLEAARRGGARWIVLCDTNGGRLPHEIASVVERRSAGAPGQARDPRPQRHRERGREHACRRARRRASGAGHPERPRRARCGNANLVALNADAQDGLRDRSVGGGAAPAERPVARRR